MTTVPLPHQISVESAMHHGVLHCPPETPLRTVARTMAESRVHCLAVFADQGDGGGEERLWGIVSDLDLVGAAGDDLDERTAGAAAASPVVTVAPTDTLERAAQLMREYQTAHLIVVDPAVDRPVGVLSSLDVARTLAG